MDRSVQVALRATILGAFLVGTALLVIDGDPAPALEVAPSDGARAITAPSPTASPISVTPGATPRGKEIYKGHTLEEIRADPSLLAEALAEGDYHRPIHGEPDPQPTLAANAFNVAVFELMEITGSNCQSSHEGQMDLASIEGMAARVGRKGGVLEDGRGWLGTIDDAREHFGATGFVAEDPSEHWFITYDPATLNLLFAKAGPAAAALIDVPLADGRIVWYLGPRWFVSIPC